MKFTYALGQRPLDGYTVKRGIGRGGFGEVFYALSDGGKEVALKLLHSNLDVELRGMTQCLNLKHPNLLALYDIKTDDQGDRWVVMEYIAGEPLGVLLQRHPSGLAQDLARQWFLDLAKAVGYLHDHGIVHRDLKPANIFLENGLIKVGDYGLCKFISSSQRNAQTQSVGTVHYMAPEISSGNYSKQIDVYSSGVILYEMLTGRVPFEGESAGEILMKHLTTPPDLSIVPQPFTPIVGRALAKDPAQRYQTMGEVAKAVAATGSPRVEALVENLAVHRNGQAAPPPAAPLALPESAPSLSPRSQLAELSGSMVLTALFAFVAFAMWAAVMQPGDLADIGSAYFLTVASCWTVLIPTKLWAAHPPDPWMRRVILMVLGMAVGLGGFWLDGFVLLGPYGSSSLPPELLGDFSPERARMVAETTHPKYWPDARTISRLGATVGYFGLAFFLVRWWKMADRRRSQRVCLSPLLSAGFWGLVLLPIWPQPFHGTVVLVTTAAIVQLVSPWVPPPPPSAKKLRLRCG